jgi:dTDP-4-dehydrorhamnose 3,5-epimerase
MHIHQTTIPGVAIIQPKRFGDHRGWFMETWNRHKLADAGINIDWVQDNHSYSAQPGVVRGLHFQIPPNAQDKLVRCARGRIIDVAVDIRHGSPTFGQHVAHELTADAGEQLLVPRGCAHAFCTLEPDCEVLYKVSGKYSPEDDRGIRWNDPDLAIPWPIAQDHVILSDKDAALPFFADLPEHFTYDG